MAVTVTDEMLQAMADAIAAGETKVTMPNGSSVTYDTAEGLIARYNWMLQERGRQGGVQYRRSRAVFL